MSIANHKSRERIKEIAFENANSMRSFALSIDCDPSFFMKILNGVVSAPDSVLDKIIEIYGVNEEWLKGKAGESKTNIAANSQNIFNLSSLTTPDLISLISINLKDHYPWKKGELSSLKSEATDELIKRIKR